MEAIFYWLGVWTATSMVTGLAFMLAVIAGREIKGEQA